MLGTEESGEVLLLIGAFILALAALALAGWLESQGHVVSDWHKGFLVAATTFFFSRRPSVPGRKPTRRNEPPQERR